MNDQCQKHNKSNKTFIRKKEERMKEVMRCDESRKM